MTETNKTFMRSKLAQPAERASTKVYAIMETVTPAKAREYLGFNDRNRSLNKTSVRVLAGAIMRGEWIMNGETIKFDQQGKLIDGQHRLAAVISAEMPVEILVVRNAGFEAQDTVDTGTRRNLGSQLKIRGEDKYLTLAASVSWLYKFQNYRSRFIDMVGGQTYPTVKQGLMILENNPGLRDCLQIASKINYKHKAPAGVMTALSYKFASLDQQDADVFFEYLLSGAELEEDDPIFVLRETLSRYADQKPRPNQAMYAAIIVKAWNAYREGRRVQRLSWSPGGSRREAFPAIK